MATAGVLNSEAMKNLDFFKNADFTSSFFSSQDAIDIARQATQAVTTATVRAGISTIINGGDLDSFKEQFIGSLATYAIAEIGKELASEIGDAVNHEPPKINEITRYLAHAGVGCLTGTLTATVNNSEKGLGCSSGAGGAVIGELVADAHKRINNQADLEKELQDKDNKIRKLLGLGELDTLENLTKEQMDKLQDNLVVLDNVDETRNKLLQLKAEGVDLAKLGAGLAAFIAKGEVNIAADAGQNAAENNAFWFVLQGAYLVFKAYEALQTVKAVADLGDRLNDASQLAEPARTEERNKILMELGTTLLTDVAVGSSTAAVLKKLKDLAQNVDFDSRIGRLVAQFTEAFEGNKQFAMASNYGPVDYNKPSVMSPGGYGPGNLPKSEGKLKKSVIPEGEYTEAERKLLKHNDGAHTIEKHGSHVTDEHLVHRLATGVAPDGTKGLVPPYSSKFDSKESLNHALQKLSPDNPEIKALLDAQLKAGEQTLERQVFDMGKTVGYGYKRIGNSKPPRSGEVKAAPAPTQQNRHYMNQVQVTYNYDKNSSTWYISTMFPTKRGG